NKLVEDIRASLNKADAADRRKAELDEEYAQILQEAADQRLAAGRLLLDAKNRVQAGEAIGPDGKKIKWASWVEQNLQRSKRDADRLIALVKNKTVREQREALHEDRVKAAEGMRASRAKAAAATQAADPAKRAAATPQNETNGAGVSPRLDDGAVAEGVLIEEIMATVEKLSDEGLKTFCDWLREYEAERFPAAEPAAAKAAASS